MTIDSVPNFDPQELKRNPTSFRTLFALFMSGLTTFFMAVAIIPLFVILAYLFIEGIGALRPGVFTQLPPPPNVDGGGFGNAILGTIIIVAIAALISVPVGIMAAIYLSEFSKGKIAEYIRFATNVLAGVPSIILGVFAFAVVVVATGTFSAWAGGFAVSLNMLPIIIRTTEEALKLIPDEVRQASTGIGANDYQTVLQVVVPAAIPSILTGVTLATARAAGETAPLLMTALFTQFWPNWQSGLWEPTASLAILVFNFAVVPFSNQNELAWAAAFVLVMLVLLTSIISRVATAKRQF